MTAGKFFLLILLGSFLIIFLDGIIGKPGKKKRTSYSYSSSYRTPEFEDDFTVIDQMEGHEFERWCADLLTRIGYQDVRVTRGSGDQGVDIVAKKDRLHYAFQCKRYSKPLGNKPIQEVYAGMAMYNCSMGAVITNQYFTQGAIDLSERTGIILIDRRELNDMIREANQEFHAAMNGKPKEEGPKRGLITDTEKMWPHKDAPDIDVDYFRSGPDVKPIGVPVKMYLVGHNDPRNMPWTEIVSIISEPFAERDIAEHFAEYLSYHSCAVCELVDHGNEYKVKARAHISSICASYWDEERDEEGIGGFYVF